MGWFKITKHHLPKLRDPMWGYGCDGSLITVCLVIDEDNESKWDLGEDNKGWCVLEKSGRFESGEILPLDFLTHVHQFNPNSNEIPDLPKIIIRELNG